MTTLLEDVAAALDAIVPIGGAWPGMNMLEPPAKAADGTVAPYIVFLRVISVDNVNLQGPSNVQNTRLQVDIFAPRYSDAESTRLAVDAAMDGMRAIPLSCQDVYEDVPKLFRITREFSLWR
jgi:hypothetical protein